LRETKRHKDAVEIQLGAVNPSGIAHAVIEACREVHEEGRNAREDAAVRLIVHQLAWICNTRQLDNDLTAYHSLMHECRTRSGEKIPMN
jgi:hypothetical protein